MIIEPGYGYRKITECFAAATDFPVLADLKDYSNRFYGKDRCDKAVTALKNSKDDYSVENASALPEDVKQNGTWVT